MQVHNEILRNIARNCQDYGVPEEAVYRQAGVDPESIALPEGMQDWKVGIKIWESALQLTHYRYISLSFGKKITLSVLGWISTLTLSSPTLQLAWQSFTAFFPLMGDMFEYRLEELPDRAVKIIYKPANTWVEASLLTAALAAEHAMSLTLSISSYLTGKNCKPVSVQFTHKIPVKDQTIFRDLFGNVSFEKSENALIFDAATARLPVISANNLIYENMLQLCAEKLQQLETQGGYAAKVLQILNSKEAFYNPKLEEVAARLNVSVRTLQRKLKEENQTYHNLLEEYQIETASQLLTRPNTQVQDVAFLLGFNNLPSFSRAFKRKTGFSPTQMRAGKSSVL